MFNQAEMQKISSLVGNTALVNQINELVNGSPDGMSEKAKCVSQPPVIRATELAIELKTYLIQMNSEAEEYDDPNETQRLQSEALGILISLRELIRHFPELNDTLA